MADDRPAPKAVELPRTLNIVLVMCALAFCASVALWTTIAGNPANSLHTSAQAWSFGAGLLILAGLGIGASGPDLLEKLKK